MSDAPARRRDLLREQLRAGGGLGLIVTHLPNVRYLSGFSGSNAALFISADAADDDVLATDGRYATQAAEQCGGLPVLIDRATLTMLARSLAAHGVAEVEVEQHLTLGGQRQLLEHLRRALPGAERVEAMRAVKDATELTAIAEACAITVAALERVLPEVRAGWTELAVARRLEQAFGELGAGERAFPTIVAAGPHAAVPHHEPTTRPLADGDLVVIDFGARVRGYHADMTRTAIVGRPAAWQVELHAAVLDAQRASLAEVAVDVPVIGVDTAARQSLAGHGLADAFVHGLGHGIGLQIHEAPMINARSVGTLAAGMAITAEPGAYLPGRGGVRIEDTLVVSDDGPRVLTEAERGLWPVGA